MTDQITGPHSTWQGECEALREQLAAEQNANGHEKRLRQEVIALHQQAEAETKALRARVKALEAALREIAAQKDTDEMSRDEWDVADFIGGYDECINTARAALEAKP